MENLLEIKNLKAYYQTRKGPVKAVDDVNFSIPRGKSLGLIGESGCGKSTIALTMLRLLDPPGEIIGGEMILEGKDLLSFSEKQMEKIRWNKVALVPQGAMNSLNPVYSIGHQIIEALEIHEKISKSEARVRAKEVLSLVGIDPSRISFYPHEFSGGMKQRVAIAMALVCSPALILADESTNGLDVITQASVLGLIKDLQSRLGASFMMISHDLYVVSAVCDLIAVMYGGKVVETSPVEIFRKGGLHPYSKALVKAFPDIKRPREKLSSIGGVVPNLLAPPEGCRFHPRCPEKLAKCEQVEPVPIQLNSKHVVSCHRVRSV